MAPVGARCRSLRCPETSGTAFFTYGLAWGIRKGLLDPAIYRPALPRAGVAAHRGKVSRHRRTPIESLMLRRRHSGSRPRTISV